MEPVDPQVWDESVHEAQVGDRSSRPRVAAQISAR